MTERELYISIIPDLAEAIVYLKRLPREEQEKIKNEMLSNCENSSQALEFAKKIWIVIETYL